MTHDFCLQELMRLNHVRSHRISAGNAKGLHSSSDSELEEMSEELSDYNEADMNPQLTNSR